MNTFPELPDALRHKVTIRLNRELTQASLLGGSFQSVKTVVDQTFATAGLTGKPLSIFHKVDHRAAGFIFTATTNTYTPYLALGDEAFDPADDHRIAGDSYQEVLTNFPFGSQILTGLFLEIDVTGPDAPKESYERTLFDRIGYAIRRNGGRPDLGLDPEGTPAMIDPEVTTINVSAGHYDDAAVERYRQILEKLQGSVAALPNGGNPSVEGAAQNALVGVTSAIILTRLYASGFATLSDDSTEGLAETAMVKAYFVRPRIVLSRSDMDLDTTARTVKTKYTLDLRRDTIRALAFPGQNVDAALGFNMGRGVAESTVERDVFVLLSPDPNVQARAFSTATVFEEALAQGVQIVQITNGALLDALPYSDEAKGRISDAIARGMIVIAPERPVTVHGEAEIAWYEVDPVTNETIGVTEDGGHQGGIAGYSAFFFAFLGQALTTIFYYAVVPSVFICTIGGSLGVLDCMKELDKFLKSLPNTLGGALKKVNAAVSLKLQGLVNISGQWLLPINSGMGNNLYKFKIRVDPPVGDLLYAPPASPEFSTLTSTNAALGVDAIPDPILSIPIGGAEVPLVYKVGFRNPSMTSRTFDLIMGSLPAGFRGDTSVRRITVPAGEVGEVGICLTPDGGIPAPGTPLSFGISVRAVDDPTLQGSTTETFLMPEVRAVNLRATPAALSSTPGAPTTTTLTIRNAGNVPVTVSPSVLATAGLTVQGFLGVTLDPGQSVEQVITFTPDAATPLNTGLTATLTANFGTTGTPLSQVVVVPLRVEAPGATAIRNASQSAFALGRSDLSQQLGNLSTALTMLVQTPSDVVAKAKALASIDTIVNSLNGDPTLGSVAANLAAPRAALAAAATSAQIQAAVTQLGNVLDTLATLLNALGQHRFEAQFSMNTVTAQVGAGSDFELFLRNRGTRSTTYDFSIEGLPADVTATLSVNSITLDPDQFTPSSGVPTVKVTVTPNIMSRLEAFSFKLIVTPREAPTLRQEVVGSLTPRAEFVSVIEVRPDQPFIAPGGTVQISTRLLNVVNEARNALGRFEVKDATGTTVFTSSPRPVTLGVLTAITTADLGPLDTTGLARGDYRLLVTLTEANGTAIPGATGEGRLFVGSPVSAVATLNPDKLATGDATTTTTLTVDAHGAIVGSLGVLSTTNLPWSDTGVFRSGNLLYAAGNDGIHVYDITDPSNPSQIRVVGSRAFLLQVHGDKLYALRNGMAGSKLFIYGLTDPTNPQLLGSTPEIPYSNAVAMVVTDTHVFFSIVSITFWLGSFDVFGQSGGIVSVDVRNPAAPAFSGILFNENGTTNDGINNVGGIDQSGGLFNTWQVHLANPTTLLVGASTSTGTNTNVGVGRVLVVDISDPTNMTLVRDLEIPGTKQIIGLSAEGNRAYLTGSSGNWNDGNQDLGFLGNVVLTTLDISDPRNPSIVASVTLDRASRGLGGLNTIGGGRYVFTSLGGASDPPRLYLIDASDPTNPALTFVDAPSEIRTFHAVGNLIVTQSASGVIIYNIGAGQGVPATVSVRVPNGTGVGVVAGSFNQAPTRVIPGPDFDTLEWDLAFDSATRTRTLSWQSALTGLQSGESRTVVLGGDVSFNALGGSGEVGLPALNAAVEQILGLDPPSRTVAPGESAHYNLIVRNPTASDVTYAMALLGVPTSWSNLPASVFVQAGGETTVDLILTSEALSALGVYGFVVSAAAPGGAYGTVKGSLSLAGTPVFPNSDSRGIVIGLSPLSIEVGPGQPARYRVRLTNVGSVIDTFNLALTLPPHLTGGLAQDAVTLSPGAGNYREVILTLRSSTSQTPGDFGFGLTATSAAVPEVTAMTQGVVTIPARGVRVALDKAPGPPSAYLLTVTNTGQSIDTFDLALAGPAGLVSTIASPMVTLNPGESRQIDVTLGDLGFALPGGVLLVGSATAQNASAIRDSATASIEVAPRSGLDATLSPPSKTLPAPGATRFLIMVENLGNVEDQYMAEVVATRGAIQGALVRGDRTTASSVPLFILPGLSSGVLTLNALMGVSGKGEIDVRIRSLLDPSRSRIVTASLTAGSLATSIRVEAPPTVAESADVTLSAIVTLPPGVTATVGRVTFTVDGVDRGTVPLSVVNGQARASLTINGLPAGPHTISARFGDDPAIEPSASSPVALNVLAVGGPRLIAVRRFGVHLTPTTLVLSFDRPLDAWRASNLVNYRLVDFRGRHVAIRSATYDPATQSVTLRPAALLSLHQRYHLTVNGTTPEALTDLAGRWLDGDGDGRAGGDATVAIDQSTLGGSHPVATPRPSHTPTPRPSHTPTPRPSHTPTFGPIHTTTRRFTHTTYQKTTPNVVLPTSWRSPRIFGSSNPTKHWSRRR
ncbi:MAG: Ig-like domain repeat protein [Isosphaeraceae bacterium]